MFEMTSRLFLEPLLNLDSFLSLLVNKLMAVQIEEIISNSKSRVLMALYSQLLWSGVTKPTAKLIGFHFE